MLLFLTTEEKEKVQRKGYMFEHLLCLYSMASYKTALYNNNFPVYLSGYNEADIILFGLENKQEDGLECVQEMLRFPVEKLNIVTPKPLTDLSDVETSSIDWDYHINVEQFDINLRGNGYQNLRYSVHRADKMKYHMKLNREFTRNHIYIMARHMARYSLDVWDFEELLSLERFFEEHNHGLIMEAHHEDKLVGFDVMDFLEDNKIMVVPLGVYLEMPSVADFLMYENIKYAKRKGYKWLDIGLACRNIGLQNFKKKWFAEPKYPLFVQTIKISK